MLQKLLAKFKREKDKVIIFSYSTNVCTFYVYPWQCVVDRSSRSLLKFLTEMHTILLTRRFADFDYSYLLCTIDLVVEPSKPVVVRRPPPYYSQHDSACLKVARSCTCVLSIPSTAAGYSGGLSYFLGLCLF